MKRICLIAALTAFLASQAWAQQDPDDPGLPDSVIVLSSYYNQPMRSVQVHILAVTDEPVIYYNFPLSWNSLTIRPEGHAVTYHQVIQGWEYVHDSVLTDQGLVRMRAMTDTSWLNTSGERWTIWEIQLQVNDPDTPQIIHIDSTWDPVYGSLVFRQLGDQDEITPAFVPGDLYYLSTSAPNEQENLPRELELSQNYPNPFNASTVIAFSIPSDQHVRLEVFDILGREVGMLVNQTMEAGNYGFSWNGNDNASGIYFYRLTADTYFETKRMALIR
jgi:hypothetical protein